MRLLRLLVLVSLLRGVPALAQTFGEITGQVTDPAGAAVPGAKITVTNADTGANRESLTNNAGVYGFPSLPPGSYNLRVEKAGFKTVTRNAVRLEVQQNARIDFDMVVGTLTESIEVSAQATLLSSENATVGTVIDGRQIVEMPLNGRNYLELVALAPNVSAGFPAAGQAGSRQGGIRSQQSISVGGQRSNFNHFTLDGVDNTDPNFNTSVVLPSIDALQEFKVQTGVYPAEFGREVTQINVSTKSGTNEYHGTLFHFLRNEKLDATNYAFTSARPARDPFKWNQFGFTVGGPVSIPKLFNGRNKLFFMANYEWFRQRRSVQVFSNLPSAAMMRGDFSERPLGTLGIFDPRSRSVGSGGTVSAAPFPGNVIPSTRFHQISQKLLEFYPTPNVATTALSRNYQQAQGRPINRDQFVGRFDFVESNNSQWSGRYSWGDENETNEALRLNGSKIITNFNQYMVSNTRVLSPAVVNETRFGFTQFYNTIGPELAFTRDVTGELKIPGLPGGPPVQWGIPNVTFVGVYTGFGNDTEGPYENNNSALQFINNTSIIRGKHTMRFGGEIRRDAYNQVGNQFARGQFMFSRNATGNPGVSGTSGDPLADFLLGETFQSEAAVSIASARYRATSFALYFDETWKVSRRMTMNFGLRYEMTPPWEDQTGRLFNGIVRQDVRAVNVRDRSLYPFFMRQGPPSQDPYAGISIRWPDIEVRQDGTLGNRLVSIDKNDWAPRVGLTWSPNDKWVIRTGAGYFYSQDTGNPRFDMARNLAGRLRFNSNTQVPNLNWDNSLASVASGVANVPNPYTFANPYDRRTPYTAQYLLNVQRELPGNTVVEAGYLGSISRHLESLRAVNETLPACPSRNVASRPECANDPLAGIPVAQRTPFPNFGRIQLVDNGGVGNYNSLGAKVTKRYSKSVTMLVSYTWSKSIDTSTAIRNQGGDTLFPQNSYCRSCERGRSSHDARHALVASGLWDLPFGKGRRVNIQNPALNTVAGGWQLSTALTLRSGFPVTFLHGQDLSNTGAGFDRPNSNGTNPDLPRGQQDPQRFFDTSTISANLPGTHGNVGRNTLNGPGTIGWDFAMHKDFLFGERQRLQFRWEAFNFPNHPVWGNPNTNVTAAAFGTINTTRTNMRQLQFALKYIF